MKLDRLVGILVVLLGRERVQAKELAEKFGVSVRTILRDVEAINLAGIPVVSYQGAGGGLGVAEGYKLDRSVLSGEDMAAILSTLKSLDGAVDTKKHAALIEKLKHGMTAPQREKLEGNLNPLVIDFAPWKDADKVKDKLAQINKAIESTLKLEFTYTDLEGKHTRRSVEPYSLILKTQAWYLYAWCSLREDFRYFKVSRMRELSLPGVPFNPREVLPQREPEGGNRYKTGAMLDLQLAFDPLMGAVIHDAFSEPIEAMPDGRLLVKTALPECNWMYGFLLSFGPTLEVLEPAHVREGLAESARAVLKKYSS